MNNQIVSNENGDFIVLPDDGSLEINEDSGNNFPFNPTKNPFGELIDPDGDPAD